MPALKNMNAKGLRMMDLVSATGVAKSRILFYVNAGLLPAPLKTSPNMAYYDPACVERLRFIQRMQQRHRLTLAEIKKCLEDRDRGTDLGVYLELNDEVFGAGRFEQLLDPQAFCRETGLSQSQIGELRQARLLLPLAENRYDQEDVLTGRMYSGALAVGIRPGDLAFYADLGAKIVDHEMALRNRMTGGLPYQQDAAATTRMVRNARRCRAYIIDRLFQHRVAAMKDLKDLAEQPAPKDVEREPWID